MRVNLFILACMAGLTAFGQSRPLVTFDTLASLANRKPQSNEVVNILGQTNVGDWGAARLYRWDYTNALSTNQNRISGALATGRWLYDGGSGSSATNVLYYGAGDGIVFSGSSPTNISANLTAGTNIVFTTNSGAILIHSTASGSGTGTVSSVDVSGGATGLNFTGGPITTSGTITMSGTLADANIASTIARDSEVAAGYQPLDTDLTAFAGLSGNGLMVRTGSGTATTRSVAGTSGRITVSDGDGVAANPTIDLVASGVSAATYNNVQNVVVDTYGRITAITNRTVLPLGSGTVLTNNQHYWASMSADRTLTFSGGTTDGDVISLFVTNTAALTLSFPASWDGAGGTAISSIYLLPANHELSWVTKNSTRIFIGSSPAFDVATTVSGLSVTFTNLTGTNRWTITGTPTSAPSDGDKGDITVSSSGTVWDIDSGVVGPTELASTAVTPASYTFSSITVDADGRITAASSGTPLADGDKGDITVSASGATWNIDAGVVDANELASTAVVPGLYTNATVVIDADGRITAATNGVAGGSGSGISKLLPGNGIAIDENSATTNTIRLSATVDMTTNTVTVATASYGDNDTSAASTSFATTASDSVEGNGSWEWIDIMFLGNAVNEACYPLATSTINSGTPTYAQDSLPNQFGVYRYRSAVNTSFYTGSRVGSANYGVVLTNTWRYIVDFVPALTNEIVAVLGFSDDISTNAPVDGVFLSITNNMIYGVAYDSSVLSVTSTGFTVPAINTRMRGYIYGTNDFARFEIRTNGVTAWSDTLSGVLPHGSNTRLTNPMNTVFNTGASSTNTTMLHLDRLRYGFRSPD